MPRNKKGVVPIHNAIISTFPHKGDSKQKHCFVMEHDSRRTFYAAAPSEKLMYLWLDALKKASKLEFHEKEVNTDEYYQLLGFDHENIKLEGTPDVKDIQKAYRKACLRYHPDKPTGSLSQFEKIQEAYEVLMSIKEAEEDDRIFHTKEFDVTVKKGPKGVGLGLVVQEDPKKGIINVTKVSDGILCTLHEEEKYGPIQPGDTLTQVGQERIKGWPLNRVVERLNEFRIPIGSSILMKFSRRLRKSGPESIRDALVQLEPEHAPLSPGLLFPQSGKSRGSPTADFGGRTNDSDVADPDLISDALREDGDEKFETIQEVRDKLRMSEVMGRGLEEENAKLYTDIGALRDSVIQAEAQQSSLKRQLEESEYAKTLAEQKIQELEKEVAALIAEPSDDRNTKVDNERPKWMANALKTPTDKAAQKRALRLAVSAAQNHDPGYVMMKWQSQGEHHSAEAKLKRLEQRLGRLSGANDTHHSPASPTAKADQLRAKLNERLEFRPRLHHLLENGILEKS